MEQVTPNISAAEVSIGRDVEFGAGVQIGAIGGPADSVVIGDSVRIGDGVKLLAPRITIGDFTTIHQHVTGNGYAPLSIGRCCWIGQNAFLNSSGPLTIEDGVTISTYSSIWTHLAGGDLLQGFQFLRRGEARLGEDCYVGPQSITGPVQIGARALLLAGSVLTHNLPANHVYGGNPAVDLTDKLGVPYIEPAIEQKFAALCRILRSFHGGKERDPHSFLPASPVEVTEPIESLSLTLGGITVTTEDCTDNGNSVFDVRDRTYSKLRTAEEIAFMRYLLPHIKFYPK